MDEPDKIIASALAASPAAPERDTLFAARIELPVQRRRASTVRIQRTIMAAILVLSASLATLAFELVRDALATFGSSPLSTVMLTTIGAFTALLFREIVQFAIDR